MRKQGLDLAASAQPADMPSPKQKERRGQSLTAANHTVMMASIVAWFALNMTIANLNKWIFHHYSFKYPALLTNMHMLASLVLGRIALTFFMTPTPAARSPSAATLRGVNMLSLVFVVSVASSNAALRYIHISFAQSIGATAPLWTVLLSKLITGQSYGMLVYGALALVSAGMILTTTGEINFHWLGFALTLVGVITRALKSILQGMLLSSAEQRLDSISLLYHMSKPSVALLTVWVVVLEPGCASDPSIRDGSLWLCVALSSCVAFFLNVANFLVTLHTSAVTLQVLGNIKVVMLIGLSVAIFGNEVSAQSAVGCTMCLVGVGLYNRARGVQPPAKEPSGYAAATEEAGVPAAAARC